MLALALALTVQTAAPSPQPAPKTVFVEPPRAREVTGSIEAVMLHPPFRQPFMCSEHHDKQMAHAGDALGADCLVGGGIDGSKGFMGLYRTDGRTNEDWWGWGAEVLAPFDGTVVGVFANPRVNQPGTQGRPPSGMVQFRSEDGTMVIIGHVTDIAVAAGARVKAGQAVAKVGNNGPARAPHVHVGAYRGDLPLQIRWDQRAMARLQGAGKSSEPVR
jgi:hypothetical protein